MMSPYTCSNYLLIYKFHIYLYFCSKYVVYFRFYQDYLFSELGFYFLFIAPLLEEPLRFEIIWFHHIPGRLISAPFCSLLSNALGRLEFYVVSIEKDMSILKLLFDLEVSVSNTTLNYI